MKRVEKHKIKKSHPFYKECDQLCFLSKNVYNSGLYLFRQEFIHNHNIISYKDIYYDLRYKKDYKALPDKISKQTLRILSSNINGFFAALKDWKKNPSKYLGRPCLPKYKDSKKGRFVCSYEKGAILKRVWKSENLIGLSQTNIKIKPVKATFDTIKNVRIIPKKGYFVIELVYEVPLRELVADNKKYAAIDIGVNNLVTLTYSEKGLIPLIINGRPIKSMNQYYNKNKALLQSLLAKDIYWSNQLSTLTQKRNDKITDCFHKTSRYIVNQLVSNNVSKLIIGYNKGWKQGINIGKKNNQNFVNVPYKRLIDQLKYKCMDVGIEVILTNESYTSKCSFLDLEPIRKKKKYGGYRKKRGMYSSYNKGLINADVNASYNIMRKVFPESFEDGIEGIAVCPLRLTPY
jgi:putative transposase